jgi:hypothetical protein
MIQNMLKKKERERHLPEYYQSLSFLLFKLFFIILPLQVFLLYEYCLINDKILPKIQSLDIGNSISYKETVANSFSRRYID